MTVFVTLWQDVKNIIHHIVTTRANINKRYGEKLALPFFYPMLIHTKLWAVVKIPHSLRISAMLKTQNTPSDHVTVTRPGLHKHEYVIRSMVSLRTY